MNTIKKLLNKDTNKKVVDKMIKELMSFEPVKNYQKFEDLGGLYDAQKDTSVAVRLRYERREDAVSKLKLGFLHRIDEKLIEIVDKACEGKTEQEINDLVTEARMALQIKFGDVAITAEKIQKNDKTYFMKQLAYKMMIDSLVAKAEQVKIAAQEITQ